MRRARCLALAALMLLAAAVPGRAEPLRMLVDTAFQPHHVPILTAVLRGHFQREGIELLLEAGLGVNQVAVLVGQRAFDIGHVTAPAAAAAIASGWECAAPGDAASLAAAGVEYGLIIVDLVRPPVGVGGEAAGLVREFAASPDSRVVVCGAADRPEEEFWARRQGIAVYLPGV
ncbi:MAG: hypothetical protein FGM36_16050, partial [Burkholderiaceae bacterium]|nr:hypothetical protein [Burkholderiaceae bacterium]